MLKRFLKFDFFGEGKYFCDLESNVFFMNKLILLILFLSFNLSNFSSIHAQANIAKPKGLLGLDAIDLSKSQKRLIKKILVQKQKDWKKLKANSEDDPHIYQINKKKLEIDILKVLTPDQLKEYEIVKARRNAALESDQFYWLKLDYEEQKRQELAEKEKENSN